MNEVIRLSDIRRVREERMRQTKIRRIAEEIQKSKEAIWEEYFREKVERSKRLREEGQGDN